MSINQPNQSKIFLLSLYLIRYVRLLGAMYMRLTGTAVDCYKYLEPLYNDYRKIKTQNRNGGEFKHGCMNSSAQRCDTDEFADRCVSMFVVLRDDRHRCQTLFFFLMQ